VRLEPKLSSRKQAHAEPPKSVMNLPRGGRQT
jgi:hypothetical protein